jgi:hypothetical protein
MLDCQRNCNILKRLKTDNAVDLKVHKKQRVCQWKKFGTKIMSPIPAQRMTVHRMTLTKIEGSRTLQILKGTGPRA